MSAPSKLTDENIIKLKQAAALDCSVEEMAYLCNVSHQTIYNWREANPELFEEIDRLRANPVLKARQTVVNNIDKSYSNAVDYLKRKQRKEFGDNVDHTSEGKQLPTPILHGLQSDDSNEEDSKPNETN